LDFSTAISLSDVCDDDDDDDDDYDDGRRGSV
jgi:hypothetical protein